MSYKLLSKLDAVFAVFLLVLCLNILVFSQNKSYGSGWNKPYPVKFMLRLVRIPEPGLRSGLDAVRLIRPGDFWAVGSYQQRDTDRTFAEHLNGRIWTYVFTPNPSQGWSHFFGVAGKGGGNVWAVGTYAPSDAGWPNLSFRPLAERWNGRKWAIINAPAKGLSGTFFDIAVLGAYNAWAVGGYYNSKISFQNLQCEHTARTLIEHWNGYAWRVVPSPDPGRKASFPQACGPAHPFTTVNVLSGITAAGPHNIWAVGHYWNGKANRTFILHWNGRVWTRVQAPNASRYENVLYSVAISGRFVWAAGTYRPLPSMHYKTLILRWNGYVWQKIKSPDIPHQDNQLYSISAWGGDIWASGRHGGAGGGPLVMHWNGRKWVIIPAQKADGRNSVNNLNGIAVGPQIIWAAGEYINGSIHKSLIETGRKRYNNKKRH